MNNLTENNSGFSASYLKLIGCIFMAIDHIGAYLFPNIIWFRIVGRIAYPIFAYFIAEGCAYTRNKTKRLLLLLVPGLLFEIVYYITFGKHYGNIFLTFSLSVVLIYINQWLRGVYYSGDRGKTILGRLVFFCALAGVWLINRAYHVEYGFFGVLVPLFAAFFEGDEKRDLRLFSFSVGLILLAVKRGLGNIQIWSLMAVPLIALYNGEPGIKKFKYGFYIFYPLHLAVIWAIGKLMQIV